MEPRVVKRASTARGLDHEQQLDEQETRLEELRGKIANTSAQRERAREEMSRPISALSFDLH